MFSLLKIAFFICLFACCGFAQDKDSVVLPEMDRSVDSTEKYNYLIAYENADARYAQNIVGMVIGGAFTGVGTYFLVCGLDGIRYRSEDSFDQDLTRGLGRIFIAFSIPFYLVGIPILTVNTYYFIVHKNHAIKFDKYRESLKLYKQRRESEDSDAVRLMIIPSVNFANASGGLNLLVAF
jgi:hypothetical protein